MKTSYRHLVVALSLVLLSIFSCTKEEDNPPTVEDDLFIENIEVSFAFDDADNLTLGALQEAGLGIRTLFGFDFDVCANTSVNVNQSSNTILVDFGTGCTSPRGVQRKGKLIIQYTSSFLFPGSVITVGFDNYEVNGKKIEGIRTITTKSINLTLPSLTQEVKVADGKITWPDGSNATITINHERIISLNQGDVSVLVTGRSFGQSRRNFNYISTIIEPLVVFASCTETGIFMPSQGIIDLKINSTEFLIDFGNGSCDRSLQIIHNGTARVITINN